MSENVVFFLGQVTLKRQPKQNKNNEINPRDFKTNLLTEITMAKRSYTALQEEVNLLLTQNEERTQKELDALQDKLDVILSNQSEILTRLGVVAQGRYSIDVCEVDVNYFPVSDPEELPKLDAYLAEPGNPYARLMRRLLRPNGEITPLKDSFVKLFTDDILQSFNYPGFANKKAFKQYKNINKTLFDIQKTKGYIKSDYITEIRAAFHLSKRRCYTRKHVQRRRSKLSQEDEDENESDSQEGEDENESDSQEDEGENESD